VRPFLAEINGVRELHNGMALNTQLCYSNPEVRRIVAEAVAAYAREHPAVDYLHVWLGDGANNHCECEACRTRRPADWYVVLLNAIDAALTAGQSAARIVFLVYVDLFWPPEEERLANPGRFVLMFAPITRTYSEPFPEQAPEMPLAPFELNRLTFPRGAGPNLAYLKSWQQLFDGDSFDFDYHLLWDQYRDFGHMAIARVLHQDIRRLRALGLNGYMSCQVQRVFAPTGLAMTVLGAALWNRDQAFESIRDDYLAAAFGDGWREAATFLETLSTLSVPEYLRGERDDRAGEAAESLARVADHVAAFEPVLREHAQQADWPRAASWRYLAAHARWSALMAAACAAKAAGDAEAARNRWEEALDGAWRLEPDLHPVCDPYTMRNTMAQQFRA
jgi:hypothetical protein